MASCERLAVGRQQARGGEAGGGVWVSDTWLQGERMECQLSGCSDTGRQGRWHGWARDASPQGGLRGGRLASAGERRR